MEGTSVKRRLVQSTLFPHREISAVEKNTNGKREAEVDEKEDCHGSGKKIRTPKGKIESRCRKTPQPSSKKVTNTCKEPSNKQVDGCDSPVTSSPSGSAFGRRPQKTQPNQRLFIDSPGQYSDVCSPTRSVENGKDTTRMQQKDNSTPRKGRMKTTPSKKMSTGARKLCFAQIPTDCSVFEQPLQAIPDLRLEAKLTAEENSRIFAGRQLHPFFSPWKGNKVGQDIIDSDKVSSFERKEKRVIFNPIHVFDNVEDERRILNWKPWIFAESKSMDCLECGCSPVYMESVDSLNFDNFLSASRYTRNLLYPRPGQHSIPVKEVSLSLLNQSERLHSVMSSQLTVETVIHSDQNGAAMLPKETEYLLGPSVELMLQGCQLKSFDFLAGSSCHGNFASEHKDHFLQERIMSCQEKPKNCLWTDKYRPQTSDQICGNRESVKFLSEWLHLWHKKGSLPSRSSCDEEKSVMADIGHDYQQGDTDSDSIEGEESLKNVLLVTGPVGSGKSTAIYCCAKDQGFQVIEINASDWRNGALIKQKIGEAMESHWLQRTVEKTPTLNSKSIKSMSKFSSILETEEKCPDFEAIDLTHLSDMESSQDVNAWEKISTSGENRAGHYKKEMKSLILFEDIDATLCEDHGFITTIQHLAVIAKRPMILTSNSDNPALPKNLGRSELSFSIPSLNELLELVLKICAAENTKLHPFMVERFVDYYQGDIRKTIMLLQFWSQGQVSRRGNELAETYKPVPFDLDAGHHILPKVIPWGYPSQLSELVEEEIIRSLSFNEEIHGFVAVNKCENLTDCRIEYIHNYQTDSIETKEEAMLDLNFSLEDELECLQFDSKYEFSTYSGSPVIFSRQSRKRKLNTVLFSDSEDDLLDASVSLHSDGLVDVKIKVCDMTSISTCHCISEKDCCRLPERLDDSHINDSSKSHEMSFVPESSFILETEIMKESDLHTTTFSYGNFVDLGANLTVQNQNSLPSLEDTAGSLFNSSLDVLSNVQETIENNPDAAENIYQEEVGDSLSKFDSDFPRGFQLLDACSQMDFTTSKPSENPKAKPVVNSVQETWNRLKTQPEDLRKYVTNEEKNAFQALQFAHGMSNLISDADLLFKDCQTSVSDSLRPITIPEEDADSYCYYENQFEISSILAQHGVCLYAKEIAYLGSLTGSPISLDLVSDMLASSASSIALGKLANQDQTTISSTCTKMPKNSSLARKSELGVHDLIRSLVPTKSYLTVKGNAFHEYLSTLGHISRFEGGRISECRDKRKQRRGRLARHYLSSGPLAMSSEDLSLLNQYNRYQNVPPHTDEY